MSIGQRISKLRRDNGYSQEYIAEKLDVSRQAVSKWETDNSVPDTYNLIALAELFGVSIEYIAVGKQEESRESIPSEETKRNGTSTQKTVGLILLAVGLLALVLGLLLSELLVLLAFYLLTGSILCIAVHKNLWFVSMWALWAVTLLMISLFSTHSLLAIFNPLNYQQGFGAGMMISYVIWIWLLAAIAITVIKKRKAKKHP